MNLFDLWVLSWLIRKNYSDYYRGRTSRQHFKEESDMNKIGKTALKVGICAGAVGACFLMGNKVADGAFWLMDKLDGVDSKSEEQESEETEVTEETTEDEEA